MKYGQNKVNFAVEGARSLTVLEPIKAPSIEDLKASLFFEMEQNPINSPALSSLVKSDDLITIVLSDITRLWSRQDLVCKELVSFLHENCSIPYENIVILIALGTHQPQTEEENRRNVTEYLYDKVQVISHDCYAKDLVYLGETSYKTPVYVNPLTVGRKVIVISSTVHHLMSGYGGGRKSILPGISGNETILSNHLMCMHPSEPRSSDTIGMGDYSNNPVHLDMAEATDLLNPLFGISIVMNKDGKQSRLLCGNMQKAWAKSCEIVNEISCVPIKEKADIVIASCGGYPKDINLYQSVKTLFNMAEAVKEDGIMIMLAECPQGGGSPDFFDWSKSLKTNSLDADLRAGFTIGGYIFYAACEAINKNKLYALTKLPKDTLADMNITGFDSIEELIKSIDFKNKSVIALPYGGSTVPLLKKD